MQSSEAARSASDTVIRPRRDERSAHTPAGTESSRNGKVCAVCRNPVSDALAPSSSTATSGAAASATCSENWAQRFDQASREKAGDRRCVFVTIMMVFPECSWEAGRGADVPHSGYCPATRLRLR